MRARGVLSVLVAAALFLAPATDVVASGPVHAAGSNAEHAVGSMSSARDDDEDGLSNAWERRWNLTDPERADTDRDGVTDGAEDPDGDGLSNLGEQRVGTNPTLSDSDHDGVDDAHDDANGNGIRDGLEQDRRPLPRDLRPDLDHAHADAPVSAEDGCSTMPGKAAIHPCVYGDTEGTVTVVLFGDSHALQWEPALIRAARRPHWRIVVLSKSGCPSVDVRIASINFPKDIEPCRNWRANAIAWIDAHPPDLVLISNTRAYLIVDRDGNRIPSNPAWKAGLRRTMSALPDGAARLILADTVRFPASPVPCLRKHGRNMQACELSRAAASRASHDAVEKSVAAAENGSFASLNGFVCSYDPCPLVMGHVMMWRDESHLTATFARTMWRDLERAVSAALH